jgi:hypothetical protein
MIRDGVSLRLLPAPDAITPDIANTPSQFPTLFSREAWERYCVVKHGGAASLLARGLFDHLARLDGSDDGVLDIHGLPLDAVSEVFGFGTVDAVFDKFEGPFKEEIRADLDTLHHTPALRKRRGELYVTKIGENRFFAVAGSTEHSYTITSSALNAAWDKAMQLHPETPWMRVVTHAGYQIGRTNNPADPDHQVANIAIVQADLLVTGGVGAVTSDADMLIAPAGSIDDHLDPSHIDIAINAAVGLAYLAVAIFGKGRASASVPPMSGGGGESPYKKPALAYPRAVVSQLVARLRQAQEHGQKFVTAYLGNAPRPTQPYVQLNVNPLAELLEAAAKALGKRPSQPSGGFAPEPVEAPEPVAAAEPVAAPVPSPTVDSGVKAPTAVKAQFRMSGGFTPPHLPPEPANGAAAQGVVEPTQPAKPAATLRDTDPQPKTGLARVVKRATEFLARPTVPITPNVALPEIVRIFKEGLARIPGIKDITVHPDNGTIYVSASSPSNQVSITIPSMTTLDSAQSLLRHLMPVLAHRAPVPLNVKVSFEPEYAFESMCRDFGFSAKAMERAKSGGIVKVHMEGNDVKKVDFVPDDAAVLKVNRITGGDLVDQNTMRIELILQRSIVEEGSFTHQHMNAIKDQLMGAILRIDSGRFSEFSPALQPLDF